MKRVILFFFFCFTIFAAFPASMQITSGILTMHDGLPNNSVYNIHKDGNGFMWFGTDMGISKYDGYHFTNYRLKDEPFSVRRIMDVDGNLFCMLGVNGSLVCFDPKQEKVVPIIFDSSMLSDTSVLTDAEYMEQDNLCVLYKKHLICLHVDRKNDAVVLSSSYKEEIWQNPVWTHICKDDKNRLVALSEDKKLVCCYNFATGASSQYDISDLFGTYDMSNLARIYVKDDCLWIQKRWEGVICYNLKDKSHRRINLPKVNFDVRKVISLGLNKYCLATWNGLFLLSFENTPTRGEYDLVQISDDANVKIKNAFISATFDEKENILWGATFGGGAVKYMLDNVFFHWIGLPQNVEANKVIEDDRGYIWLAGVENGLLKSTDSIVSEKMEFELWGKIKNLVGKCALYKDKKGFIWAGDSQANFYCIDPATDQYTSYRIKWKDGVDHPVRIYDFCLDAEDDLWIATSYGLALFDRKKNLFTFMEDKAVAEKRLLVMKEDADGDIWIGTQDGLVRMVKGKNHSCKFVDGYEASIGNEDTWVYSIFINSNNRTMVGYADKLLCIDNENKDRVEKTFMPGDNLPSGHIYCIAEDNNGNLWMGSNSGIMTLKVGTNLIYTYSLVGNNMAVCLLKSGRLLWITLDKLLYYNPSRIKSSLDIHPIALSRLIINNTMINVGQEYNGQVVLPQSIATLKELTLNYSNKNFTLFLTDLQYKMVGEKIFYRMLPDDENWAVLDVRDGLTFTNLSAGKHVLQVQAVAYDGNKGEIEEFTIHVLPHWALTWQAWVVYCLLLVALIYSAIRFMRYRVEQYEQKHLAEERLKNELYRTELKHRQDREATLIKNKFYGLITNELRTPLIMIVNPLREILKMNVLPDTLRRDTEIAYYNSIGLKEVCTQLTEMYKMETDCSYLQIAKWDMADIVEGIISRQQENLNVYNMDIHCNLPEKGAMEIWMDRDMMDLSIRILLSNAYRHMVYIGKVEMFIYQEIIGEEEFCVLSIRDTGKEKVEDDMETFLRQVYSMGSVIDLSRLELGYDLIKNIVEQHHGKIVFNSKEGVGTQVLIKLRCGVVHFSDDPKVVFVQNVTDTKSVKETFSLPEMNLWNRDESEVQPDAVNHEKKTLLIVEDNQVNRLFLKVQFANDYRILEAENGQEGIDIAVKELPDVILCDVVMPVKSGFDCCRELKGNLRTCHIPIIFLTAKGMDEDIMDGMEMGADDYLQKPLNADVLRAKIASIIKNRESLKQSYMRQLGTVTLDADSDKTPLPVIEDAFVKKVMELIEDHMQEVDFGVIALAKLVSMSQPTLYRRVKQSTGLNIAEFIRGVRLKKAKELLEQGSYTIQEVVEMVGYNDQASFRRHFMNLFKMTPSAYIKQYKASE